MAYTNFDEFFAWYTAQIREQVPDFEEHLPKNTDIIHSQLRNLTGAEVKEMNEFIKSLIKLPKDIRLIYFPYDPVNKLTTFASTYDTSAKKFNIYYPTVTWFMREIPECIKEVIKHEMGHILNKDCFVESEENHQSCVNRSMDARINMHLNYDQLDYASRCLNFVNEPSYFVKPQEYYPEIGLEVVEGGYSWDFAHEQYHRFNKPMPGRKIPKLGPFRGGYKPGPPEIKTPEDNEIELLKLAGEIRESIQTLNGIISEA